MSNQDDKKRKPDITVEIDRSSELKEVEEENARLKIEKEHLESTLSTIASKELDSALKSHGMKLSDFQDEEDALKALKDSERKSAPHGGDTLSWSQNIGEEKEVRQKTDLASLLVDNTEEGLRSSIEFLNWKKSHGTESEKAEAKRLLGIAEKRVFSKNKALLDVEFSDDIHALTRHEIAIRDSMTDEEKTKIEAYNAELRRKRANWKQKE